MAPGTDEDKNLALFIDFDNIALGLKGSAKKFRIRLVLERLLEKGKIIIKKAYADWSHYPEYKNELHAAGIEMIEIPKRHLSGKNSADIRLAVDAMDLCWSKEHLDTFVILSGDSDFSPLVAKLRENNKSVIAIGVRESSSALLIENCDEFIFYEDLTPESTPALDKLPTGKAQAFGVLVSTVQALIRENKEVLYGSMVKDTLKRKHPSFTESSYGSSSFSELLEDARDQGIVEIARNQKAGGTWVVTGLGRAAGGEKAPGRAAAGEAEGARRPRTRRRGTGRGPGSTTAGGNQP
jgi:uncharacterized protein (TIGR00288 family)